MKKDNKTLDPPFLKVDFLKEKWSAYVFLFSTIYINGKQEYEKK